MKYFFHKIFFLFLFSFFFFLSSFSQYTIPWATQQPAWVFPIWFEDGMGQKDTVYFGYDIAASKIDIIPPDTFDTRFGEKLIKRDTSAFDIYFVGFYPTNDSVLKTLVTNDVSNLKVTIEATKGYLPLKISWDVNLFRSDSLPFPDQSPAPRAQGRIDYDPWNLYPNGGSGNCFFDEPVLLTDTGSYTCIKKDSVVFYYTLDTTQNYPIPYFSFSVEPWTGGYVGTSELIKDFKVKIFPNPFSEFTIVEIIGSTQPTYWDFILYDVFGREVLISKTVNKKFEINRGNLPGGIYFYNIKNEKQNLPRGKIIIQ